MEDVSGPQEMLALRRQAAVAGALVRFSESLFRLQDEEAIFALTAQHAVGIAGAVARGFLLRGDDMVGWPPHAPQNGDDSLIAQLKELRGKPGALRVADRSWAVAMPLIGLGGVLGYLVVTAPLPPPDDERVALGAVAMLAGAALAAAVAHRRAGEDAVRLQEQQARLDGFAAAVDRYTQVFETLARTVSSDGGELAIARALHALTGLTVVIESGDGERRGGAGPEPWAPHLRPDSAQIASRLAEWRRTHHPVRDGDLAVVPVAPHGEVLGALALVDADRSATPFDLFALEQAAMVLAIEMFYQHRAADVRRHLERDFVDDLVTSLDDAVAYGRAQSLGRDLSGPRRVLLLQWQDTSGDDLAGAAERALARIGVDAMWCRRDGKVVVIVAVADGEDPRTTWLPLHASLATELGPSGRIGVGAPARTPSELPRSSREASQALAIRADSRTPFGVTAFEHLGVYRILARGESRQDVELYVREWLGPLTDYDAARGTDMVGTVAAYCESGGNYDRTALLLGIHRSTLRYRLQRVRQISGHDLNNMEARFNLQVAVRAWRIMSGAS